MREIESNDMFDSPEFRLGRIGGSLVGLFESAFLIVKGAGTIGIGSAACGTGVLCWAGAGAIGLGSAEVAAGGSVAVVSLRDLIGQVAAISSGRGSGWISSPNQMNHEIRTGNAPDGVIRVDQGRPELHEQPHVHFENGAALNRDGSWKHGFTELTRKQIEWLRRHGWTIP
jgi:hypothetical protein